MKEKKHALLFLARGCQLTSRIFYQATFIDKKKYTSERETDGVSEIAVCEKEQPPTYAVAAARATTAPGVLCTYCFAGNREIRNAKCSDCYRVEREEYKKRREAVQK